MIKLVANVPKKIQETKAIEINENSTVSIVPDAGFHGLAGVDITVNTPEPFKGHVYNGNCEYAFHKTNDWLLKEYADAITTENITDASYMFQDCTVEDIFIDLNFNDDKNGIRNLFAGITAKEISGKIRNLKPTLTDCMFKDAYYLRHLPEFENLDMTYLNESTGTMTNMFYNCYSLREIPSSFLKQLKNRGTYRTVLYCYAFGNCYVLDELVDIPVLNANLISHSFTNSFIYCSRAKDIIFETNEDGTAKTANWKSQTIDLSTYVGYTSNPLSVTNYNSGITADKKVTDAASYEALKDDADWFTADLAYSRYNHDSAVRTINSLPDTSAYGANTIKFKKGCGSATDGGSVDSLTDVEIAVATAKGWTVAYA